MPADNALLERLISRLRAEAGAAGWGYYSGKSSRVEPTCWALLALGSVWREEDGDWPAFARPHVEFLQARQGADGLLVETEPSLANFGTQGFAALLLMHYADLVPREAITRLVAALVRAKGVRIDTNDPAQDNTLQGWAWVQDTFSWLEPTAWCLLALKRAASDTPTDAGAARIAEAERLMINRSCRTGGWNYGNASALGQELRAYVPTTALGLLAMQDRRDEATVQRSLEFLEQGRLRERSTLALSLTALCLRIYGRPGDDLDVHLSEAVSVSERRGHLQAIAMAAYALSADRHEARALRVPA